MEGKANGNLELKSHGEVLEAQETGNLKPDK